MYEVEGASTNGIGDLVFQSILTTVRKYLLLIRIVQCISIMKIFLTDLNLILILICFYAHDIDCKYCDFDDNVANVIGHKNVLTLPIISLNIHSVPKHLKYFKLYFGGFYLHIVALTETRLTPEVESL